MILVPTEEHLGIFTSDYNFIKDTISNKMTGEYFYKDIVSIQTSKDCEISLTFTDSKEFNILLPVKKYEKRIYQASNVPFVSFDKAIQVIRTMVKSHKKAIE